MGRIVDASFFEDSTSSDSLPYKIAGTAAKASQGLTANFGDELTAAVNALPGYLGLLSAGNPEKLSLADVYRTEKEDINKALGQFEERQPELAIAGEVGGSLLSPLSKIKAGSILGSAALQSGIMGAGEAENLADIPASVLESGAMGAGTAGALGLAGKGLKAIGSKAGSLAEGTKNKLLGLQYSDIKRSLGKDVMKRGEATAPIVKAANSLYDEGAIVAGEATENFARVNSQLDDLGKVVSTAVKEADTLQVNPLIPKFNKTEDFISQLDSDERKQAYELYSKYKKSQLSNNALFSDWDAERRALSSAASNTYGASGADQLSGNIKKYMALDIKNAIYDELDQPGYKQLFKSKFGDEKIIQKTRQEMEKRFKVLPALEKGVAREASEDADTLLTSLFRTTGGYGVPMLLGAGVGEGTGAGALTGAAAGLALRSTAGRKALIPTLKGIGAASTTAGKALSESALPAARAIQSLQDKDPTESKSTKAKTAKIVDASFFEDSPVQNISFETALETPEGRDLILDALREVESGGDPNAVSPAGAMGAYQFMPKTAKSYGIDPFDEAASRIAAEKYLLDEYSALGDVRSALAAYNAGRPRITKARENAGALDFADYAAYLPQETQEYAPKIELAFNRLLQER